MDLEQVKQFIEANKDNTEVQGYIGGFVTPDRVTNFLDSEDGKKILQPKLDSHFTKGLETWKTNHLQKIINDEIAKANPAETEEQKQLRELKQQFETLQTEKTRETLKNLAITEATQKGLPVDLIDFLVSTDEDTTKANLTKLEQVWQESVNKMVDEKFKDNGRTPFRTIPDKTKTNSDTSLEELANQFNIRK